MSTYNYVLSREDDDYAIEIHANYCGASRGYRDSLGVPEEPDEPAHWEIEDIYCENEPFHVTEEEEQDIIDYLEGLNVGQYYDDE